MPDASVTRYRQLQKFWRWDADGALREAPGFTLFGSPDVGKGHKVLDAVLNGEAAKLSLQLWLLLFSIFSSCHFASVTSIYSVPVWYDQSI